jgi:hypothetical protein
MRGFVMEVVVQIVGAVGMDLIHYIGTHWPTWL